MSESGPAIVASAMTVSDKIRALDRAGYPRAEIARMLGKRYQHVRNVLEADRVAAPQAAVLSVEEPTTPFDMTLRLEVEADGSVRFPREIMAVLGIKPGGVLVAEVEEDRLVLLSTRAAWKRVQAMLAPYNTDPTRLASEELIAERRAEVAREDNHD